MRLLDEPEIEVLAGTPAELVGMVAEITEVAWAFTKKPWPDYERATMPGRVVRRAHVDEHEGEPRP